MDRDTAAQGTGQAPAAPRPSGGGPGRGAAVPAFEVKRGTLRGDVFVWGVLEAASPRPDVVCEVEGTTVILKILPEGTAVKQGDLVCELDSSRLRDRLAEQEIATKRAEADVEQSRKTHEVAEIAVKEYIEGTFPQDEQSAEGQIKLAEADLMRAQERLQWSDRMLAKKVIDSTQNQADKLVLQKAQATLRENQTKLEVLRKYTREKQVKELQANVEKAKADELARKATYNLEQAKERRLRKQIEKCKLFAPADGEVVHANEPIGAANPAPRVGDGATVREGQLLFSVSDPAGPVQVRPRVREALIDRVKQGEKVSIRVDAFPDTAIAGVVTAINLRPDRPYSGSDVRTYGIKVKIEDGPPGLRRGMSARVELPGAALADVLWVPDECILEYKGKDYVYLVRPGGPAKHEVALGDSFGRQFEVRDGLVEGDRVALDPIALMSDAEKREALGVTSRDGRARPPAPAPRDRGQDQNEPPREQPADVPKAPGP
jgi:RND family efflux transporter MFP subunit